MVVGVIGMVLTHSILPEGKHSAISSGAMERKPGVILGVSLSQPPPKISMHPHRWAHAGLKPAPLDRASEATPREGSPPPAVASRHRAVVWLTRFCPGSCSMDARPSGSVSGKGHSAM